MVRSRGWRRGSAPPIGLANVEGGFGVFLGSLSARCMAVAGGLLCVLAFACVTADRSVAACPNEAFVGFSEFLAGCGGYERVTPAFKAGSPANIQVVAAEGSRVIEESTAVFAGAKGESKTAYYESVRSGSGWVSSALNPSSSLFPAQERVDVSADLSRSVWEVRRSSQSVATQDLAVREPDGSFVLVGPMVPPALAEGPPAGEMQLFEDNSELVYAGASPDLSRIFFEMKGDGPKWPGDTTNTNSGAFSLYEYVGTGAAEPVLVGTDSEGHLISDCTTSLGSSGPAGESESFDGYDAVSTDGETVYFTATGHNANGNCSGVGHAPEFNELYAQVGSPPSAHNVAISEPSAADCAVCQTASQANAEFQGASRDGSKVFFLTEQELFKENTTMNLYEYDFANRPGYKIIRASIGSKEPLVQGVARVSVDGSHVYFVAQGVLTSGPNAEGDEPVFGGDNLYVFERDAAHPSGRIAFIATLSAEDERDWEREDNRPVQATPDGRFLVFQSVADLTSGDASTEPQIFEYDAAREELVRASVGAPGYAAGMESAESHASRIPVQRYAHHILAARQTTNLAVSNNGSVVVFESRAGLTAHTAAASAAGHSSVFEYRSNGVLSAGSVFQVSNGSSLFDTGVEGTDASGEDVFIRTLVPVLGADGDTAFDVYDARDGGGFPPLAVTPDCEKSLSCQGAAASAPALGGVGSGSALAGGNAPTTGSPPPTSVGPPVLSRAQKLARALRVCRKNRRGHKRRVCEASARRRFGSVKAKGRG
jgi:hypothetical protein